METWWLAPTSEEERGELRRRNLGAFKQKYAQVYEKLERYVPRSKLVFGSDGQPDMEFSDVLFYDGNIEEFTESQLKKYWASPKRVSINPPQPDSVDDQTSWFLDTLVRRLSIDSKIELTVGRGSVASFHAIVLGVGLGRHLPELVEKTNCLNLFLLEPNWEGFHHSLELFDWEALLLEMQERNGDVFFYIDGSPQNWMDSLRVQIRYTNNISLDGMNVYTHYPNSLFAEFDTKLKRESQLLMSGLGFFYDETLMLRNAQDNLKPGTSRMYHRAPLKHLIQTPAVIVGCGPSLDDNIETIKSMQDKAVIISCGSALGPLLAAGITPDFQMELENLKVMQVMGYAADIYDLSDICLVASATVERKIKDYFKEVIFYSRPALCPYAVFSNQPTSCIQNLDPTVVNVGLGFALEAGFLNFYFFGADMGRKGTDRHHATSSYHYSDRAKNDRRHEFNIDLQANFGGKAQTTQGLFWALDSIQRSILQSIGNHKFHNCSDGVMIKGARPKLARTIDLPELKDGKSDLVREIVERSPLFSEEDFAECWQVDKLLDAIDMVADQIVDIIDRSNLVVETDYLIALTEIFYRTASDRYEQFARLLLRGSCNMALICVDYYLSRVQSEDRYDDADDIGGETFEEFVGRLRQISKLHVLATDAGYDLTDRQLKGVDPVDDSEIAEFCPPEVQQALLATDN